MLASGRLSNSRTVARKRKGKIVLSAGLDIKQKIVPTFKGISATRSL
jgi:hypothetical protein